MKQNRRNLSKANAFQNTEYNNSLSSRWEWFSSTTSKQRYVWFLFTQPCIKLCIHFPLFIPSYLFSVFLSCCSLSFSLPSSWYLPLRFILSASPSSPLFLPLWQHLLNKEQPSVKTGEKQCVLCVSVCDPVCLPKREMLWLTKWKILHQVTNFMFFFIFFLIS